MPAFEHQQRQSAGLAPTRTKAPLLPVESDVSAANILSQLLPKVVKNPTPGQVNGVADVLQGLQGGNMQGVARRYTSQTGRSLLNDLLQVFEHWIDVRRDVAWALQSLVPNLTWHAFLEQLAYGAAYAQKADMSDAKGAGDDTNMAQLIKAAGFKPGPLVRGRWGLQFRTFKPHPYAIQAQRIVVFRGTEGIRAPWNDPLNPATREGMVDTWIGDFTRMGAGYPQYNANAELIRRNLTALGGKVTVTGHSLGGGLAQIVTAKCSDLVGQCVTFNAPGINKEDAKSLEKKNIPTVHHRTSLDLVPSGNSRAAPGSIMTYERFRRASTDRGWQSEIDPTKTHNHMSLNGLLNYEPTANLTPMQKQLRDLGANGPTAADQKGTAISALASVHHTSQDPVMHAGEVGLNDNTTYQVFRANLGYNLLVEFVEDRVAKLDPGQLSKQKIDERLEALQVAVVKLDQLPITKEAYALFERMGLKVWETWRTFASGNPKTEIGALIELRKEDKRAVALQVEDMWQAWWPGK